MTFTDKTIFSIRLRQPLPQKDVDSRDVSDDDYVFHRPFVAGADVQKEAPMQRMKEKTARLLEQAVLQKKPDPN